MWVSIEEYIIEEQSFNLKTSNCESGKVILQLMRRDVRMSFFLFPKKVTKVICLDTGKKIKKSKWSLEIIKASENLKANLKVPTWGYWTIGILFFTLFFTVPIGFYLSVKDSIRRDDSFLSKNVQQRKYLLQDLGEGDLVATSEKVYMISKMDDKYVTLIENENPAQPNNQIEKLTNEQYPEESFTGNEIKVLKIIFETSRTGNKDHIINILDN